MKRLKLKKIHDGLAIPFHFLEELGFEKVNIEDTQNIWYEYLVKNTDNKILEILVDKNGYFKFRVTVVNNKTTYDSITNTTCDLFDIPEIFEDLFKLGLIKFVEEE